MDRGVHFKMITITNNGGTLTMTNKGDLYNNKPSNTDNVYKITGANKVNIVGAVNNAYFTIDNPNDFSIFISYGDKAFEVTPGLIEPVAVYSNDISISADVPFDVNLLNVSDAITYDVLSSLGARVSEMFVLQEGNQIIPNKVSVLDNSESFIGDFGSRVVNLEVFDEYMDEFNKELSFDVFHTFIPMTTSEFFDMEETTSTAKIGTFKYDAEESSYDDRSRKHTIVGYEDIAIYNEVIKIDIPQNLTGDGLMEFITNYVGKSSPEYLCDIPMSNYIFTNINHNSDELTKLSYWIKWYAELNLCNAYIINDRLTFISLIEDEPEYTIRQVDYSDPFEIGDMELINTIVFEAEEAVEDPLVVGNEASIAIYGERDFRIVGNQLINLNEREVNRIILNILLPKFFKHNPNGYFYKPFKTNEIYINPRMGFTNSVYIEDRDFNVWRSHITQYEWTYTPGVKGKVEGVKAPETIESDDITKDVISQLNMGIRVDRINQTIESIIEDLSKIDGDINLIYNLSMTVGDYYGWDWENTDSIPLILPFAYKFNLQYGTNFEIVNVVGSRSKTGQSFFNNGTAISPYAYVRGGLQYSGRIKITEGHGLTIEVREYNIDQELIKTTPFNFEGLGFHDFTITSSENTKLIRLAYIVDGVSIANRVIVADSIFNRGQPRNWEETPDDFEFWTRSQILQLSDSISSTAENLIIVDGRTQSNKSQILQQTDLIRSTVERIDVLGDDVVANKSSIAQTAEQIELKVSKGDIASTINLTEQSATIDASKINLTGYATFASLEGNGTTTIDGSNINTGVLKSNNGKTKLDLDGGTFLIGDSPSNYELYFNGSTLALGGNTTISWANIDNKPYIPSQPSDAYITNISKNAITTEFLNARNITAENLDSGTINIGSGQFTVDTSGKLTAGGGGFVVPPNADGIFNDFGGFARWKLSNSNYILQGPDHIAFYFSGETVFHFNKGGIMTPAQTTSGLQSTVESPSMRMGDTQGGVVLSTGTDESPQLQIRDVTNSAYINVASSDFVVSSSQEFKQEIKPTKTKLDMVKNTEVFDFEYKEPTGEIELFDGDKPQMMSRAIRDNPKKIGFIAENSPNEMVMPLKEGEIGVSMTNTVGILWKAVQELSAEVDKLKESK